jgi:hypothetical protein
MFNLSTRWRLVVTFMSQLFYAQGKSPRCPLSRRMGKPRASLNTAGKKNLLILPEV